MKQRYSNILEKIKNCDTLYLFKNPNSSLEIFSNLFLIASKSTNMDRLDRVKPTWDTLCNDKVFHFCEVKNNIRFLDALASLVWW